MRKIEKAMCEAVRMHKNWKSGNTRVENKKAENGGVETYVYLHDNLIFEVYENLSGCYERYFTLAGWNTNTTKSRLRALGVDVSQRCGVPFYEGNKIGTEDWYMV